MPAARTLSRRSNRDRTSTTAAQPSAEFARDTTWQMILRRLPAIVWTTDRKLKITSAGGTTLDELKAPLESLVGQSIRTWFETEDNQLPPIIAHREALQGHSTTLEHVWRRKAYQFYIEPLHARSGKIEGCVGLAVDITPRQHREPLFEHEVIDATQQRTASAVLKKVGSRLRKEVAERRSEQDHLRDAQSQFLQLASSIESIFWIYDVSQNRILYLSPGYTRVWGHDLAKALHTSGHAITRDAHDDDRARLLEAERLQRAGQATCEEFRIRRADGQWRWIRSRAFPILSTGKVVQRIAGIAEDITQTYEADLAKRRQERLATVGNFAAGIAHEVNNPLGAALAATQAAMRLMPEGNESLKQCLETTLSSIRQCSQVVKSLLRFCRDEPTSHETFDLREVIAQAESLTRTYASGQGTRITPASSRRPIIVRGNPLEMEIVLVNLFRNAIEAGAKNIHCQLKVSPQQVVTTVTDDGRGIDDANLQHLCEPFFTTRRNQGGTGLGLSIVHGIVKHHGGELEFRRNPQIGMTVRIVLPRASKENEPLWK